MALFLWIIEKVVRCNLLGHSKNPIGNLMTNGDNPIEVELG